MDHPYTWNTGEVEALSQQSLRPRGSLLLSSQATKSWSVQRDH